MKTAQVKKLNVRDRMIYWMTEREIVRKSKEAFASKPWTDDEILQKYRFCNVRRMDDAVSLWLLKNWYEPNYNHRNILYACCLARFINQPSTLKAIGFPKQWDAPRICRIVRDLQKRGQRVYNPAYMIRGNEGRDKIDTIVNYTIQPVYDDQIKLPTIRMLDVWELLTQYNGFGSFMAGQVVADLRWAMRGLWKDRDTWAPMGPGSQRGLNRFFEYPDVNEQWSEKDWESHFREFRQYCEKKLPKEITYRLEAHDYQNCLCEFDKYERTLKGESRPKHNYPGV